MKKFLCFMVMSLVALFPFAVDAATSIKEQCSKDANGIYNCTINYSSTAAITEATVTITEVGGAEVQSVTSAIDSDWTISSQNELNGVWTIILTSPVGMTGEGSLFSFSYKPSGTTDCKVQIALGDTKIEVTPEDTPTENKDTGSTLPYIALGAIALVAVGSYVATKNKSKVYKI